MPQKMRLFDLALGDLSMNHIPTGKTKLKQARDMVWASITSNKEEWSPVIQFKSELKCFTSY